jgi:hypothetical protein
VCHTEAEYVAAVEVVQNMLFVWRVLQSIGLKVKLPMKIDNKGAVDLANGWTANSRTRYIATRVNFLRELKDERILYIQWISTNTCPLTSSPRTSAEKSSNGIAMSMCDRIRLCPMVQASTHQSTQLERVSELEEDRNMKRARR